jgi:hypothetical protein
MGMVRSERVNRVIKVLVWAAALLAMTLAWAGVSVSDLLHSVLK